MRTRPAVELRGWALRGLRNASNMTNGRRKIRVNEILKTFRNIGKSSECAWYGIIPDNRAYPPMFENKNGRNRNL